MHQTNLPGGAFILQDGRPAVRVKRESFPTEDDFQELIADTPELLSGDLLDPDDPVRWLLIDREVAIGDSEESEGRWSVDHIFVDQHGTPTFVEVKRRSDSRLKRDVIGQVFGYIAFSTAFVTGEKLRETFIRRVEKEGLDADEELRTFLGTEANEEEFWNDVGQKMKSGAVRAMIVADEIPFELRRVLEFMNEKLEDVELLGLELQLYSTAGYRTLVPRLIGRTAQSEDRKALKRSRKWSLEEVLDSFSGTDPFDAKLAVRKLVDAAQTESRIVLETGTGGTYASLRFRILIDERPVTAFTIWHDGHGMPGGNVYFGALKSKSETFARPDVRRRMALMVRNSIDPAFDPDAIDQYPSFEMGSAQAVSAVIGLMHEIVQLADENSG